MWVISVMLAAFAIASIMSGVIAEPSASISVFAPQVTIATTKSMVVVTNRFTTFTQVDSTSLRSPMVASLASSQSSNSMKNSVSTLGSSPHSTTTSTKILVSTTTDPPSETSMSGTSFTDNPKDKSKTLIIIGVIVAIALVALLAIGLWAFLKRRNKQNSNSEKTKKFRLKANATPLQKILPVKLYNRDISHASQGSASAALEDSIQMTPPKYYGYLSAGKNGIKARDYGPEYEPGGSRRPPPAPRPPTREKNVASPTDSLATQSTLAPQNSIDQRNTRMPTYPTCTTLSNIGNVLLASDYGSQSSSPPPRPKRTDSLSPSVIEYMNHRQGTPSTVHGEVSDKLGELPAKSSRYTMMSTNSTPFGTSMTPSLQGDIMDSPAYRKLHKMKFPPTPTRPSYISESVYSEPEQRERSMSPQPLNVVKRPTSDPTTTNNNGKDSSSGGNQASNTPANNINDESASTAISQVGITPASQEPAQNRFQDADEKNIAKRDAERKKAYEALQRRSLLKVVDPRVPSSIYSRNVDGTPVLAGDKAKKPFTPGRRA